MTKTSTIDISAALPAEVSPFKTTSMNCMKEILINGPMVESDPTMEWKDAFGKARELDSSAAAKIARPGETLEGESSPIAFDTLLHSRSTRVATVEVQRSLFVEVAKALGAKANYRTVTEKVRDLASQANPELWEADRIVLFKV